MAEAFSVRVTPEPVCRALAGDVARRYFELVGASPAAAAALAADVAAATGRIAVGDQPIDLVFTRDAADVRVDVSCGGRTERCHASVRP